MTYQKRLNEIKDNYPFDEWIDNFSADTEDKNDKGIEQYTQENCDATKAIFDYLLGKLYLIGEKASELNKIELFEIIINSLNRLNDEKGLFDFGVSEDLCDLVDEITLVAGLNPEIYANGKGIPDIWREW
ncbi:hypothetical protein [Flavobacterium sp. PL02]|uniref:hypothetical protein n=1 Tax=Flavobacterium sp. PL02 TaxID=3088354 RepID=UPI002B22E502|nr:hypothetical protein [Flavobacterium sp. PL02]MEA9414772.1 hypothetical protein [Flavobacterium sp. PL02]